MRKILRIFALLMVLWITLPAASQNVCSTNVDSCTTMQDTCATWAPDSLTRSEKFFTKRWVQSAYIGLPLVIGGTMQIHDNKMFRYMRNNVTPSFHTTIDDYLQYAPAVTLLAMKAAGVKGNSSWGKMLTADAFSTLLMAAAVNGMKYTIRLKRPDGSSRNSFPSGHTATAFLTATLLHKEYGERYPWISAAGYTVAASVGGMRMLNNRHWMSDVLAGAGIGIMAGEFGYWLSDLVFPSSPRSYNRSTLTIESDNNEPSYIGIGAGNYIPLQRTITEPAGKKWSARSGGHVTLDGAWFWNRHFGVGGLFSQSNILYNTQETIDNNEDEYTNASRNVSIMAGICFNLPFINRLSFTSRALMGGTYYFHTPRQLLQNKSKSGITSLMGIGLKLRSKEHLFYKLTVDYMIGKSPVKGTNSIQTLLVTGNVGYQF